MFYEVHVYRSFDGKCLENMVQRPPTKCRVGLFNLSSIKENSTNESEGLSEKKKEIYETKTGTKTWDPIVNRRIIKL